MTENVYPQSSLLEKANLVQAEGQLIEAQDYYSFFVLLYLLNKEHIKLFYDFSGDLISIETQAETDQSDFIADQLMSNL
jgi:hypothetical protein